MKKQVAEDKAEDVALPKHPQRTIICGPVTPSTIINQMWNICKHCKRRFFNREQLKTHESKCKHSPLCQYCNKKLINPFSVRRHEKKCKLNSRQGDD